MLLVGFHWLSNEREVKVCSEIVQQKNQCWTGTVTSLAGFEFDQLRLIGQSTDDGLAVQYAQPSSNGSDSVWVDDACLKWTACNNSDKPTT